MVLAGPSGHPGAKPPELITQGVASARPSELSETKPMKSSFHSPCQTQARTCLTLGAANLAYTLNLGPALTPAQLLKPFSCHTCAGQ